MELVKVKSDVRYGIPTISVNKSGVIRLSLMVKNSLGLKAGDKVGFYFDKDKPKDWFIKINDDDDIILRNVDKAKSALLVNSSNIANTLLKSIGFSTNATMRIVLVPVEEHTYCILTASAKGE